MNGQMTKRILLAGLLGGLAMYVWTSVAHVALPLGETGVSQIAEPGEPPFLDSMKTVLKDQAGLYIFPGMPKGMAMDDYSKKLQTMPSGLLVYKSPGAAAMTPGQLAGEFVFELLAATALAFLLANSSLSGFGARLTLVLVAAFLGSTWTNYSYWNWYSFPTNYTVAAILVEFTGLVIAGLVAMRMLKR
jgi:hypothetical protein